MLGLIMERMDDREPRRLRDMRNLGPASERMLQEAGISTPQQLDEIGAVEAYRTAVAHGADPTLNLLWALDSALLDIDWRTLPDDRKAELRAELTAELRDADPDGP